MGLLSNKIISCSFLMVMSFCGLVLANNDLSSYGMTQSDLKLASDTDYFLGGIVDTITDTVTDTAGKVKDAVTDTAGKAKDTLVDTSKKVFSSAKDLLQSSVETIAKHGQDIINSATAAVKEAANKIKETTLQGVKLGENIYKLGGQVVVRIGNKVVELSSDFPADLANRVKTPAQQAFVDLAGKTDGLLDTMKSESLLVIAKALSNMASSKRTPDTSNGPPETDPALLEQIKEITDADLSGDPPTYCVELPTAPPNPPVTACGTFEQISAALLGSGPDFFKEASQNGAQFNLQAKDSPDRCVDASRSVGTIDYGNLYEYPCHEGSNQKFTLEPLFGGVYYLIKTDQKKCFDANRGDPKWGYFNGNTSAYKQRGNVYENSCAGVLRQQWIIEDMGEGYYRFRNRDSNACIEAARSNGATGYYGNLFENDCAFKDNQKFKVTQ